VDRIDRWGVETLSGLHWPLVTPAMKLLSATHREVLLAVAVAASLRLRRLAPLLATAVAMILASPLDTVLKHAVGRSRPPLVDPHVHPLVALPHDPSMPSGHALTSFACAVALGAVVPRLRAWLLAYAGLVALSRPYLGVHYPSDVIVGGAVGAVLGLAVAAGLRLVHVQIRSRRGGDGRDQRQPDAE
jgi:undecaprenyl-diphosphatase